VNYTGKPCKVVTGLYGYRDYAPALARFTSEDPVRDNWFVYVNNDPVNWIDPWGLEPNPTVRDILTSITNPIGAFFVLNNKRIVESYIRDNYEMLQGEGDGLSSDGHNDRIDAFRHTAWNALNAKYLGEVEARRFADAHEARPAQPDDERTMDLNNNEIGRRLGASNPRLSNNEILALAAGLLEDQDSGLILEAPGEGPKTYKYGDGYGSNSKACAK
jgi:RHS repeat-associated protein